ncbi:hypothetical protein GCM10010174_58080 [Kutzneria viridogrisea]
MRHLMSHTARDTDGAFGDLDEPQEQLYAAEGPPDLPDPESCTDLCPEGSPAPRSPSGWSTGCRNCPAGPPAGPVAQSRQLGMLLRTP